MSRLSDPHLMKLATYALLPVKRLQWTLITACIIRPHILTVFLLQLFVSPFLSHRFPDVAPPSLVDFLYCLVSFETWPKFRVATAPGLKFRVVSRPPWPCLAARLPRKRMTRLQPNAHKHDNVWLVTTLYSYCPYIYSFRLPRCNATIHVWRAAKRLLKTIRKVSQVATTTQPRLLNASGKVSQVQVATATCVTLPLIATLKGVTKVV